MKEKPILFSGEMVKAILDGRKTQTRRVIKPLATLIWGQGVRHGEDTYGANINVHDWDGSWKWAKSPYGKIGDRLWVKETFKKDYNPPFVYYRADYEGREKQDGSGTLMPLRLMGTPWKPSIFMPRQCSRITLEITAVRAELVQDISELDAIAEGIPYKAMVGAAYHRYQFQELWDKINGKKYPWKSNPAVWVYTFKRVQP